MLAEINAEKPENKDLTPAEIKALVLEAMKPEVKPEDKPGIKPVDKPIIKPITGEAKPEVKPNVKPVEEPAITKEDLKNFMSGIKGTTTDVIKSSNVKTRTGQEIAFIKTPDVKVSGTGF